MSEPDTSFFGFLDWLHEQIGESVYREAMGLRHVPDPPLGCECGAELHDGPHEGALACEEARLRDGCTCDGYWCEDIQEVAHDGYCDLAPPRFDCNCGFGCPDGAGCCARDESESDA